MRSPFPGMDPYLERPAHWRTVHYWLIAAIADQLRPAVSPRYWVAVEERVYEQVPDDLVLVGIPDVSITKTSAPERPTAGSRAAVAQGIEVILPIPETVHERYLALRDPRSEEVVTVIEVLSPSNKRPGPGRDDYLAKRNHVLASAANLVEIDLLRAGQRMPMERAPERYDYGVLVQRRPTNRRGVLFACPLREPLPVVNVPLRPEEEPVELDLQACLADAYERGGFGLVMVDYSAPPEPRLDPEDSAWAASLIASSRPQ